jgi:hypothetical protein
MHDVCWQAADKTWSVDDKRMAAAAALYADDMMDIWADKITAKIAELDAAEVHDLGGVSFCITGTRHGEAVRIEQRMILSVSSKGKLFNQYPLRIYLRGKLISEAAYMRRSVAAWGASRTATR